MHVFRIGLKFANETVYALITGFSLARGMLFLVKIPCCIGRVLQKNNVTKKPSLDFDRLSLASSGQQYSNFT